MGLGLHGGGVGTVQWLLNQGAIVTVTDLRPRSVLAPSLKQLAGKSVTFVLGRHRLSDFRQADLIIKNPAVPHDSPYLAVAGRAGIPIETDAALFFANCPAPVIGITGSKGKSTVTMLAAASWRAAGRRPIVVGNIGISLLASLSKIKITTPVIAELSSWQLEGLAPHHVSPHVAVLTNVYPEHLNRYRSYAHYRAVKKLIVRWQTATDVSIINRDNPDARRIGQATPSRRYWFSKKYFAGEDGCYVRAGVIWYRQSGHERRVLAVADISLRGEHNLENVLAAATLALSQGIAPAMMRRAVRQFTGVPHRLELVRELAGVAWYNDTTATMPEATIRAIQTLKQPKRRVILIAGGADKKSSFAGLAAVIQRQVARVILLPGTATPKIITALKRVRYQAYTAVPTMIAAVELAQAQVQSGDTVVLSPACASFGLFVHEFDRGQQFIQAVRRLRRR